MCTITHLFAWITRAISHLFVRAFYKISWSVKRSIDDFWRWLCLHIVHREKFMQPLDQLFQDSKRTLISAVEDGIRAFDYQHATCLQTDWSKEGIGYPSAVLMAGNWFTTDHSLQQELRADMPLLKVVVWSLEHTKMFVLGCKDLIVTTDHKPLLGIFNDGDLGSISNHVSRS